MPCARPPAGRDGRGSCSASSSRYPRLGVITRTRLCGRSPRGAPPILGSWRSAPASTATATRRSGHGTHTWRRPPGWYYPWARLTAAERQALTQELEATLGRKMMASWMWSHFTNDDIVKESRLIRDYDIEVLALPLHCD
jgi:hypothetical protein